MQAAPGSSKIALPFLAICALGCILLFICIAIVLALIPVYLPKRDFTPAVDPDKSTEPFFLQYSAASDGDHAIAGNLDNPGELGKALNLPDDVEATGGVTAPDGSDRRRRSFFGSRPKRDIILKIILIVRYKSSICNTQCLIARRAFKAKVQKTPSIPNCPLKINGGVLGTVNVTVILNFVAILKEKPSIFRGPPSSIVFTSSSSGEFTDSSIWDQKQLPNGPCDIVIAAGTTVTLSRPALGIAAKSITIYGTLILGGGNTEFTFRKSIAVKVRKGGKLQDATTNKIILIPLNSVIFLFPGGGFAEAGTIIRIFSPAGVGDSFTITNPTGPFTCAALPSGTLRHESKIIFFAVPPGGPFKSGSSYCGGSAPTVDDCTDSPCGLEILAGCTLSTADLNGVLDINFDKITIAVGAILQLGTPGSSNGFKFKYPVDLECAGTLSFVASGGGILLPIGSFFKILTGGFFISVIETFLQIYDPISGALGAIVILSTSFSGPFGRSALSLLVFIDITDTIVGTLTTTLLPTASVIPD